MEELISMIERMLGNYGVHEIGEKLGEEIEGIAQSVYESLDKEVYHLAQEADELNAEEDDEDEEDDDIELQMATEVIAAREKIFGE